MSVRDATVHSVNAVFAQLDLDVGPEEVRKTAYDMGITTHLDGFPAEGIGGLRIGVTPLEMANAYATLANGGIRNTATAISKVEFPNGDTDVPEEEERTRAFSDGVAYEVTDVLKGVITSGTGTAAEHRLRGRGRQDRDHRRLHRRLVRRLHAAVLDRGLGRLPGRADVDGLGRLRRHLRGADLARLHAGRAGQRLPRLPAAREPGRVLDLERLPHRLGSRAPRSTVPPPAAPATPVDVHAAPGRSRRAGTASTRPTCTRPAPGRAPQPTPGRRWRPGGGGGGRRGAPEARARPEAQPAEGGGRAGARDARRRRDPARRPRGRAGAGHATPAPPAGCSAPTAAASGSAEAPTWPRSGSPSPPTSAWSPARAPSVAASCAGRSSAARWRSRWRHRFCRWTCSATSPTLGWGRCTGSTPTTSRRPRSRTISPPLGWRTTGEATSVYGPLFTLATYPLGLIGVPGALWALKAVSALSVLGIAALVARLAAVRGIAPAPAAALVALNPLVLVHVIGGPHNDGLMALAMLAGRRPGARARARRAAGASLVAGVAVKAPAALAAPFALLGAGTARRRARLLAGAAVARRRGRRRWAGGVRLLGPATGSPPSPAARRRSATTASRRPPPGSPGSTSRSRGACWRPPTASGSSGSCVWTARGRRLGAGDRLGRARTALRHRLPDSLVPGLGAAAGGRGPRPRPGRAHPGALRLPVVGRGSRVSPARRPDSMWGIVGMNEFDLIARLVETVAEARRERPSDGRARIAVASGDDAAVTVPRAPRPPRSTRSSTASTFAAKRRRLAPWGERRSRWRSPTWPRWARRPARPTCSSASRTTSTRRVASSSARASPRWPPSTTSPCWAAT